MLPKWQDHVFSDRDASSRALKITVLRSGAGCAGSNEESIANFSNEFDCFIWEFGCNVQPAAERLDIFA
jgi:hypothetical protein